MCSSEIYYIKCSNGSILLCVTVATLVSSGDIYFAGCFIGNKLFVCYVGNCCVKQ